MQHAVVRGNGQQHRGVSAEDSGDREHRGHAAQSIAVPDPGTADEGSLDTPLLPDSGVDTSCPPLGSLRRLGEGKATAFGTAVNVTNNVIGAGMLSLPYVLREASFVPGLLIITAVCVAAMVSFYMLAACCELTGHSDYRHIGSAAFGSRMGVVIQATVLCYTAMACTSFCVLLGDLVPDVAAAVTGQQGALFALLGTRQAALPAIGLLLLLPMSCARDLRHLQHSSALALGCDAVAAAIIVFHFLLPSSVPGSTPRHAAQVADTVQWLAPRLSAVTTAPIVVVAANSHYNAPRYYCELRERSINKLGWIISSSLSVCIAVYLAVASSGYLQFGTATTGDIFLCYASSSDVSATIGRAALSFHLAMTFPLIFNALRLSIHTLFFSSSSQGSASEPMSAGRAALYSICLVPPIVAVAVSIPEINIIFSFNGSLFGALIVYIFPASMYRSLLRQKGFSRQVGSLWATAIPATLIALGVFLMVTGTTVTALQKAHVL